MSLGLLFFFPKEEMFIKQRCKAGTEQKKKGGERNIDFYFIYLCLIANKLQHQHDGKLAQENEARGGSTCS